MDTKSFKVLQRAGVATNDLSYIGIALFEVYENMLFDHFLKLQGKVSVCGAVRI